MRFQMHLYLWACQGGIFIYLVTLWGSSVMTVGRHGHLWQMVMRTQKQGGQQKPGLRPGHFWLLVPICVIGAIIWSRYKMVLFARVVSASQVHLRILSTVKPRSYCVKKPTWSPSSATVWWLWSNETNLERLSHHIFLKHVWGLTPCQFITVTRACSASVVSIKASRWVRSVRAGELHNMMAEQCVPVRHLSFLGRWFLAHFL